MDRLAFRFKHRAQLTLRSRQGPTDVLIKINATGICYSDLHFMMNDWAVPPMSQFGTRCAGHEGAGVIVKVGHMVQNLKVGDRAGFKPIADTCGACELCRRDKECYCAKAVLTGLQCDGGSAALSLEKVLIIFARLI